MIGITAVVNERWNDLKLISAALVSFLTLAGLVYAIVKRTVKAIAKWIDDLFNTKLDPVSEAIDNNTTILNNVVEVLIEVHEATKELHQNGGATLHDKIVEIKRLMNVKETKK